MLGVLGVLGVLGCHECSIARTGDRYKDMVRSITIHAHTIVITRVLSRLGYSITR